MRLLARLADHAARRPESLAASAHGPCAEEPLTYGRLWESVRAAAVAIDKATPAGGAVLLSCANRPEFLIAYLGILASGRTVFPVHPRLSAPECLAAREAAGANMVIGEGTALEALRGVAAALPVRGLQALPPAAGGSIARGSPGLMLQSSGTTGLPKIVYRIAGALDAVAENVAAAVQLREDDRVLGVVPLAHSYGMENALLGPVWAGASVQLCDGFDVPSVASRLAAPLGPTVLPGAPFMFEMLGRLHGVQGRGPLRLAYSAGSSLPEAAESAFAARFGLRIGQLYGATEVGSVTFNEPGSPGRPAPGFDAASAGVPMAGVDIEIDQSGEVLVHAPSMLDLYVGDARPPCIERHGRRYFPTGDLGRIGRDGGLRITGRLKLLIDIGGTKVNPLEVEQVIESCPGVGRCAVVPVRVSETVSRVKAVLTPSSAGESPDVEAIRDYAQSRLTGYKVPRVFEVRESLPLSPTGKVLRWKLSEGGGG